MPFINDPQGRPEVEKVSRRLNYQFGNQFAKEILGNGGMNGGIK